MFDIYDDEEDKYCESENSEEDSSESFKGRKYLGIMFNCCGAYGRVYKNKEGTAYVGRCPRCMKSVKIAVGDGGTDQRFFNAY